MNLKIAEKNYVFPLSARCLIKNEGNCEIVDINRCHGHRVLALNTQVYQSTAAMLIKGQDRSLTLNILLI